MDTVMNEIEKGDYEDDGEMEEDYLPDIHDPFQSLPSKQFVGHRRKVSTLAWNCTGKRLASGSVDNTVKIWHVETHSTKLRDVEFKGHMDSVENLAWDPNNSDILISASHDRTVRLWDLRSSKCEQQVTLKAGAINVCYRPDSMEIAVGNNLDEVAFMDVRTLKTLQSKAYKYEANEISWDLSGNTFFVATGAGTIEVLEYPSLTTVDILCGHGAGVYSLDVDPKGRYLAAGGADGIVTMWDMDTLLCSDTYITLDMPVRTVSFSHDGEYLAFGSGEPLVDIAHVESGESVHQIPTAHGVTCLTWNPRQRLLAYACDEVSGGEDEGSFRVFGFDSSAANGVPQLEEAGQMD